MVNPRLTWLAIPDCGYGEVALKSRLDKITQIGVASVLFAIHARTGRLARGFVAAALLGGALASVSNVSAAASTVLIQGTLTTSSGDLSPGRSYTFMHGRTTARWRANLLAIPFR
jgi:hypothetical protein